MGAKSDHGMVPLLPWSTYPNKRTNQKTNPTAYNPALGSGMIKVIIADEIAVSDFVRPGIAAPCGIYRSADWHDYSDH